jgi:geranylgeranyl diphosphate/geranylgeranyl-bacteriochlorophyllide a reductase
MMNPDAEVAVVGAGPGGATAAYHLATQGLRVIIFDHSHPREKVCGGGLSAKAVAMFPELNEIAPKGRSGHKLRIVSPQKRIYEVSGGGNTFAVDRSILDEFLLARAIKAGAVHRKERVRGVSQSKAGWHIETSAGKYLTPRIIGADGANSLVRRTLIGPIPKRHLALGAHVLVPDLNPPSALIKLFGDARGYAWVFNRKRLSSVGIGIALEHAGNWRERLRDFALEYVPDRKLPPMKSWILPYASDLSAFDPVVSGQNWSLIGDAAGHVDPMTGEGILYAMWGGRLAAKAIIEGDLARYDEMWREAYLPRLKKNLKLSKFLTRPRLLESIMMSTRLPLIGALIYRKFNVS